jgi:hypothetical protein
MSNEGGTGHSSCSHCPSGDFQALIKISVTTRLSEFSQCFKIKIYTLKQFMYIPSVDLETSFVFFSKQPDLTKEAGADVVQKCFATLQGLPPWIV